MRFWPSPCSEFPNDNPELHDGCVWICSTQRARPKAVVRAQRVAAAQSDATRRGSLASECAPPESGPFERVHAEGLSELEPPAVVALESAALESVALESVALESVALESVAPPPRPELVPPSSGEAPLSLAELMPSASGEIPATLAELRPFAPESAPDTVAPNADRADLDTLIETLGHDPFVAELYSLVAPLRAATSAAQEMRSAEHELPAEPVESSVMNTAVTLPAEPADPDDWESQWSLAELDARREREEREIHELEREVSELRELRAAEPSEPVLTVPSPPPEEPALALEPLTLEDFLSGGSLQLPETPASPTTLRGLPPIELELEPLPAEARAWDEIISAVSRDLLERNAVRAAALLPRIVEGEPMRLERLPSTQKECLLLEGIAELQGTQLVLTAEFMRRARRLRQAFVGGRLDAPTLANWLASIVRALLASPSDQQTILSEWRDAGVIDAIERAA